MMEPPEPPSESDCCNSGCNPCILDVYQTQLKKYEEFCQNHKALSETINCVSPTSYTVFVLSARKQIAATVFLLTFSYGGSKAPNCFKYNPGQYLLLKAKDYDGEFTRAYTPLPIDSGHPLSFTILVRFYTDGRMSQFLDNLQIGAQSSWRGPYGDFSVSYKYKFVFMIAQGTGIAPLFALIDQLIHNEECESFVKLFFCCRSCDDILLREQLYELGAYWNFSYEVFLKNTENLVRKYNETVHKKTLSVVDLAEYVKGKEQLQALICGSEAFGQNLKNEIEGLGIESSHIYLF